MARRFDVLRRSTSSAATSGADSSITRLPKMHGLANDTAQGQALGTLASCAKRTLALTGTFSGGYADEAFNNLFRLYPHKMLAAGFEFSQSGLRSFAEA